MATLPEQHYHCCVTSPPYFGLRSYLDADHRDKHYEVGSEATPDEFVAAMLAVFGGKDNPVGVWRALRDDGVLWLNLGDSYFSTTKGHGDSGAGSALQDSNAGSLHDIMRFTATNGLKPKDLIGIPWRVAFALQAAGWYLRDAVIWHKPAPMPGSQTDRCTSSYEFIFQLTKSPRYYFDMEAIKERQEGPLSSARNFGKVEQVGTLRQDVGNQFTDTGTRTPRNVWKIAHWGFKGAHFATFPRDIPTLCIKASTSEKGCCDKCGAPWQRIIERDRKPTRPGNANVSDDTGKANRDEQRHVTETRTMGWEHSCACAGHPIPCRVLDPFSGAGTTGIAANLLGHDYTGCELNPEYAAMADARIARELRPNTAVDNSAGPMGLFSQ